MLQLVLGRAGSGKTEYVFSQIKNLVEAGEENILLLTPEQYSFVAERRLLNDLGESKVNCVTNGSFSRLSNEINKEYGGNSLPILSKGAKAVVFKKACENVKEELLIFNKNVSDVSFINSIINIYDEMKSCRVSNDEIMSASQNTDKVLLSNKLHDISVIMESYDNMIKDKYLDTACELTELYQRLLKLNYFSGKTVFIDGFTGFIAQEYKILEVILKQAKNVYITMCTNSFNGDIKYDLYSYVNSNIAILKDVCEKANIMVNEPIYLDTIHRFNNEELRYAEKYAFAKQKVPYTKDAENIKLYCAKSINDECDYVSRNISNLLREGIKASKITVICRDLDKYKSELEFSFRKFNIPFFDDERQNITSQPLIMFVNFLLRVAMFSFRSDDIFSLLKTGLTSLDNESINDLENYAFMWGINGSKWKNEFVDSTRGFAEKITDNDQKKIDKLNETRKYVVDKLELFKNSCKQKNAQEISKAIYYTLLEFSVDKRLNEFARELDANGKSALANEQGRVWDLLMQILDKLVTVCDDEKITVKEYSKLFNLMISNEDLGIIPTGLDNVQLGSADRIRCDNPYAVFVVGANEGEFPQSVSSAGLLSESDRVTLINNKFKLYSYGETLNAQETYFAYMALSSATDKIYISYRTGADENCESTIVFGIKQVFSSIKENSFKDFTELDCLETNENALEYLVSHYQDNNVFVETLKKYFKDLPQYSSRINATESVINNCDLYLNDKDIATKLFGKDMYLSASRVEEYYNCQFRYFCKFGLNARPRQKAEMNKMQSGILIHFVLENIIKNLGKDKLITLSDEEIKSVVKDLINEYYNNMLGNSDDFSARLKQSFYNLANSIAYIVQRLRDEFQNSDFEPKAFELKIGNDEDKNTVKSPVITLEDGGSISINGYIDRVDTFIKDNIQYVRVVDYKSGPKVFELNDILNGLNLQMFIYLFALCKSDNELSGVEAGVLYMHAARNAYTLKRNSEEKDIEKNDDKNFLMSGVVLNDENHSIAQNMEYDLKGKFIPVVAGEDGFIAGDLVSIADMGRISKKIDSLIENMGINLHNGVINQNPVESSKHSDICRYCDYKDVCVNRIEISKNEIEEFDNREVLEILKGENVDA